MRYCEHCGAPLDGDALFCTKCGARLNNPQPASPQVADNTITNTHVAPAQRQDDGKKEKKNNRIILFVLLGIVLVAGALVAILTLGNSKEKNDRDVDDTEEIVEQTKYRLHGAVDKYPIYMKLTIEGNVATGSYYYESQGPDKVLNLKGIYEDSKLELFETDEMDFGKIKIGDYTSIGANCMIMPGVTIGNNCVVGGGSVVSKSVPDGCMVAGNPAKFIGYTENFYHRLKEKGFDTQTGGMSYKEKKKILLSLPEEKFEKKGFVKLPE